MSRNANELFQGSDHALIYSLFRPASSPKVIQFIMEFVREKKDAPFQQALDIGCGNGQSTIVLASDFQKILAIDVSQAQIEQARRQNRNPNITYEVGSAEQLPLPDSSVDLISMANCAHWVDWPEFIKEAQRVLKPGGVAAMYGYTLPKPMYGSFSDQLRDLTKEFADVQLNGYWNPKVFQQHVRRYRDLTLPFAEFVRNESIYEDVSGTLGTFLGLLETWSALQTMKTSEPEKAKDILLGFQKRFLEIIGETRTPEEIPITVRWEYHILIGRKPF